MCQKCQTCGKPKYTPLEKVCIDGKINQLRRLIASGVKIDESSNVAFVMACISGHLKIVKILIENGANVNTVSSYRNYTPLLAACEEGNLDIVKLLFENGADIHIKISEFENAISISSSKGHYAIVEYLLEQNVEPLAKKTGYRECGCIKCKKHLLKIEQFYPSTYKKLYMLE